MLHCQCYAVTVRPAKVCPESYAMAWHRLAQQQDLEQDILAWEGLLAPDETAARDAMRAWVDARFAPRITEVRSHT